MAFESDADVIAALEGAAAQDAGDSTEQAPTPAPSVTPPAGNEPATPVQPAAPAPEPQAPEAPAVDTFDGGKFNPDTLDPALRPAWAQLQAAFTQKTQALAERGKQLEELGDVESLQQAAELYRRVQDPSNWAAMHAELTEALKAQGTVPAAQAEPAPPSPISVPDDVDPELKPLLEKLQQTEAKTAQMEAALAEIRSSREQEIQAEQAELQRLQMLGEITRQENAIKEMNPHYTQGDVDSIYELAPYHGGNLLAAQAAYERITGDAVARYFDGKKGVAAAGIQPASGLGQSAQEAPTTPQTFEEAAAEAEEMVRQLQAAGELDMTGF